MSRTTILFVRHAQSVYGSDDRNRPLTEEGLRDRGIVLDVLKDRQIDAHPDFATEEKMLCDTLEIIREYYHFSEEEKDLALMLYQCVKPLFGNKIIRFRELKDDWTEVRRFLDETELYLMKDIDFRPYMTNGAYKVNKN